MAISNSIFDHVGDIASSLTAITAVFGYLHYRLGRSNRVRKIEQHLNMEGKRLGARLDVSIADIVAMFQIQPQEVLEAIRNSHGLLTRLDSSGSDIWSRVRVTYMTKDKLRQTAVPD